MEARDLLIALVAYGCFGNMGHTDYGDAVYPLESYISCDYPKGFEDKYPNVDSKILQEWLVMWLKSEGVPNVQG